jgi:hypothetical protein
VIFSQIVGEKSHSDQQSSLKTLSFCSLKRSQINFSKLQAARLAEINGGALTSGFSAFAKSGKIYSRVVIITVNSRRGTRLAIRLVALTEEYDKSKTVGGPIDAIELSNTGSVRWVARKCNCPENQD